MIVKVIIKSHTFVDLSLAFEYKYIIPMPRLDILNKLI